MFDTRFDCAVCELELLLARLTRWNRCREEKTAILALEKQDLKLSKATTAPPKKHAKLGSSILNVLAKQVSKLFLFQCVRASCDRSMRLRATRGLLHAKHPSSTFGVACLTLGPCCSHSPLQKKISPALVCRRMLTKLMADERAACFMAPVDAKMLKLHDYHKIVKEPMDLGTLSDKLANGLYKNLDSLGDEFYEDVLLVFNNALLFNNKGDEIWEHANGLKETFQALWAKTAASESNRSRGDDGKKEEKRREGGGAKAKQAEANVQASSDNLTCKICFKTFHSTHARSGHMKHCRATQAEGHQAVYQGFQVKSARQSSQSKSEAAPFKLASVEMLNNANNMRDHDMLDQVPALPLACVLSEV